MKTLILALSAFFMVNSAVAADADHFQIRPYETQVLKNGLKILWIPDNSLPYVALNMMVKSGSADDPSGKAGLASFTANMLEKGTHKRTALQISEDLEQIGSSFDVAVERDYTMLSTSALSFHKDNALKQFSEIVLQPSFTLAEIQRFRKITLGSLQNLPDHPEQFSQYLFPHFLYGDQPYGHDPVGTPHDVQSIKRTDLQKFYEAHLTPGNSVLAVVGQFDQAWKDEVVKNFEAWKAKTAPAENLPDFPQWKGREVLLVDKGDLNQAQIQIGTKGIPRDIPEYLEYRAAIKILGESFGSRLFDEIRVKRGLTYHIAAWFDPRLKAGPMGIYTFTRVDKIQETVEETLKTFKKFVDEGVTESEVDTVKALMRGQFPRVFETPEELAKQLLILERYGISADYLRNYLVNLRNINKERVNTAIKKYFNAENLRILVFAPKAKAMPGLQKLGKFEVKFYKDFLQ